MDPIRDANKGYIKTGQSYLDFKRIGIFATERVAPYVLDVCARRFTALWDTPFFV